MARRKAVQPTYQERRLGVATESSRRPPAHLLVSDMGTWPLPARLRPYYPEGVRAYQIVDAHGGYAAAESWLIANGFGHARAWHYALLKQPLEWIDADGHRVVRWMRLWRVEHVPSAPGRPRTVVYSAWDGSFPATDGRVIARELDRAVADALIEALSDGEDD